MTEPAYPAARTVAPKVEAHFAHHFEEAVRRGVIRRTTPPDADTIEAIIDASFWASLRREESYVPKISLALLPPDAADHPLLFEQPLPLHTDKLVKLAPAVERPGIHLGVWRNEPGLYVWGTVRMIPALSSEISGAWIVNRAPSTPARVPSRATSSNAERNSGRQSG